MAIYRQALIYTVCTCYNRGKFAILISKHGHNIYSSHVVKYFLAMLDFFFVALQPYKVSDTENLDQYLAKDSLRHLHCITSFYTFFSSEFRSLRYLR